MLAVAQKDLHELWGPIFACPWVLIARVLDTGSNAFGDSVLGQEFEAFDPDGIGEHFAAGGRLDDGLEDRRQEWLDILGR